MVNRRYFFVILAIKWRYFTDRLLLMQESDANRDAYTYTGLVRKTCNDDSHTRKNIFENVTCSMKGLVSTLTSALINIPIFSTPNNFFQIAAISS
jgi:hypothetical protein